MDQQVNNIYIFTDPIITYPTYCEVISNEITWIQLNGNLIYHKGVIGDSNNPPDFAEFDSCVPLS